MATYYTIGLRYRTADQEAGLGSIVVETEGLATHLTTLVRRMMTMASVEYPLALFDGLVMSAVRDT